VYSGQARYHLGPGTEAVSLPELMAELPKL
jgi:hypothetical protein